MNRKMVRNGLLAVALLLLVLFVAWRLPPMPRKMNTTPLLQFEQGGRLGGYSIYTHDGAELDIADLSDKPTLVIFGMDGCRDCLADFPSYHALFSLYNSNDFAVAFVWDNTIPQEQLDELGIPPSASYTAGGSYKFTDWVPYYYFVDKDDAITYTTSSLEEAVAQLPSREVLPADWQLLTGGKSVLLGIDRCGACKAAETQLSDSGEDYLYYLEGVEQLTDQHSSNTRVDPYRILSRALGIDEYPVYISVDNAGQLVVNDAI